MPSFRVRIALLSAVISGAVLVAFGLAGWAWLRHERLAAVDREIRALAYRHPGWMNNRANYERLAGAIEFIFGSNRNDQIVLLAQDASGNVRYRSPHWPVEINPASFDLTLDDAPSGQGNLPIRSPQPDDSPTTNEAVPDLRPGHGWGRAGGGGRGFGPPPGAGPVRGGPDTGGTLFTKTPRFFSASGAATTWRFGILGNSEDRLVVGIDCASLESELARLRNGFLLSLPVALGLVGAGGWWVAGRAVRPLRRISRAAELITARGLDQRIPDSEEDLEIHRLIVVLNGMMDRLERSFRQASRFSADASHELKTPLAIMQGELEQAIQLASPGSPEQEIFASLLDETQRLKSITRSLLLLARADAGQLTLSREATDLGAELGVIVEDAQILAEEQRIQITSALLPGVIVPADRALIRLAISNLVENAIHYNTQGGRVDVRLEHDDVTVRVRVANSGPGIPPQEQSRVFERFHRGTQARGRRRDGVGLGLSLAREIAVAHHGDLVLVRSDATETVFELFLPKDA